jgi:hypothetical protein
LARSRWLHPIAVLLLIATFFTGCLSTRSRVVSEGEIAVARSSDQGPPAEKARARDVAVALYIVGGFLILGAVIVDVFILPWTIPHNRVFFCTEGVVEVCYR